MNLLWSTFLLTYNCPETWFSSRSVDSYLIKKKQPTVQYKLWSTDFGGYLQKKKDNYSYHGCLIIKLLLWCMPTWGCPWDPLGATATSQCSSKGNSCWTDVSPLLSKLYWLSVGLLVQLKVLVIYIPVKLPCPFITFNYSRLNNPS